MSLQSEFSLARFLQNPIAKYDLNLLNIDSRPVRQKCYSGNKTTLLKIIDIIREITSQRVHHCLF